MLGIYHEAQWESPTIVCGVENFFREKHMKEVKVLRSDNRGEYKSDHFLKLYHDEGIAKHFIVRKTPQKKGRRKDGQDFFRENLMSVIQYRITKELLG